MARANRSLGPDFQSFSNLPCLYLTDESHLARLPLSARKNLKHCLWNHCEMLICPSIISLNELFCPDTRNQLLSCHVTTPRNDHQLISRNLTGRFLRGIHGHPASGTGETYCGMITHFDSRGFVLTWEIKGPPVRHPPVHRSTPLQLKA